MSPRVVVRSLALAVALAAPLAGAADDFYAVRPASIDCVVQAAEKQGVPANILLAISSQERGKNGQSVRNANGTLDLGHFQLNTTHWEKGGFLSKHPEITKSDIAWRGCYNAEMAAYYLKTKINENTKQDFWTRVANYHSKTKEFNDKYKKALMPYVIEWGRYLERTKHTAYAVSYR